MNKFSTCVTIISDANMKQSTTGIGLIASQHHQRLWVIRGDHWCKVLQAKLYSLTLSQTTNCLMLGHMTFESFCSTDTRAELINYIP